MPNVVLESDDHDEDSADEDEDGHDDGVDDEDGHGDGGGDGDGVDDEDGCLWRGTGVEGEVAGNCNKGGKFDQGCSHRSGLPTGFSEDNVR